MLETGTQRVNEVNMMVKIIIIRLIYDTIMDAITPATETTSIVTNNAESNILLLCMWRLQCNVHDDDAINNDNAAPKYAKERDNFIVRCFPERNSIFTSEISQMRCHLRCPICWFKYLWWVHALFACCFTRTKTSKRTTAEHNTTQHKASAQTEGHHYSMLTMFHYKWLRKLPRSCPIKSKLFYIF